MLYNTYERGWLKDPTQEEVEEVLREAYENGLQSAREGRCADYIPDMCAPLRALPRSWGHMELRLLPSSVVVNFYSEVKSLPDDEDEDDD